MPLAAALTVLSAWGLAAPASAAAGRDPFGREVPAVEWTVRPAAARARQDIVVEVRKFSAEPWSCRVSFLLRKERTGAFRCGDTAASVSLAAPDVLKPETIDVGLGYCSRPGSGVDVRRVCWADSRKVPVTPALRRGGASRPAVPAGPVAGVRTPAPAAPATGEKDGAVRPPVGSFRTEDAPEAQLEVPASDGIAIPQQGGSRSAPRRVRGLDGKIYEAGGDEESFAEKNRLYRSALLEDEAVRRGYADWGRLSAEARLEVLRRAAAVHAGIFGTTTAKVGLKTLEPKRMGMIIGDEIWIDPDKRSFQDRDEALGLLTHEATHHYQRQLVDRLRAGLLEPGTEEHRLAEEWGAEMDAYCCEYCERFCDYAAYRKQSLEQSAFEAGEAATLHLRRRKRGVL